MNGPVSAATRIDALEIKARALTTALPVAYRLIVAPLVAEIIATLRALERERHG